MQGAFATIARQLKNGIVPHAYLFSGADEETKEQATVILLESFLGKNYQISGNWYELLPEGDIGKKTISIDMVRAMRRRAFETSWVVYKEKETSEPKKIFVIRGIETLSRDAAPLLLKMIEEPARNTIFIATTVYFRSLLPTIQSRFIHIRFYSDAASKVSLEFQKLISEPVDKRVSYITKLLDTKPITHIIRDCVLILDKRLHMKITDKKKIDANILTLKHMLAVYPFLNDPSVNKRLLAEYAMMLV